MKRSGMLRERNERPSTAGDSRGAEWLHGVMRRLARFKDCKAIVLSKILEMSIEPARDPKLSERMQEATSMLHQSVVPVFVMRADRLAFSASGVLLNVGVKHYLMTASHVAESAGEGLRMLYEDERGPGCYSFKNALVRIDRTEDGSFPSGFDIAVFSLPPKVSAAIGRARFLRIEDVAFRHNLVADPGYIFSGYPGSEQILRHDSLKVFLRLENMFTYASDTKAYTATKANWKTHILLDYPAMVVGSESIAESPSGNPKGKSGGGSFFVSNLMEFEKPIGRPRLIGLNSRVRHVGTESWVEIVRMDAVFTVLALRSSYIRKLGLKFAYGPNGA